MTTFRYPAVAGGSEAQQIAQLRSYLHQLVDSLNVAMQDAGGSGGTAVVYRGGAAGGAPGAMDTKTALETFNAIKGLIIKSADIVEAYYDQFIVTLNGSYFAGSDFGEFVEETSQTIEANSNGITQLLTDVEAVKTEVNGEEYAAVKKSLAYIRSGLLEETASGDIYGVEIGQTSVFNGVESFNAVARFTPAKLSFFDSNGNEVAYISDKKLYITEAETLQQLRIGNFVDFVEADGGVVTKWVPREE